MIIPRRKLIAGAAASLLVPWHLARAQVRFSTRQVKRAGIPRIDRSHPLAQGLVFYGFDTGAGTILDLASNGARAGARVPGATKAPNGVTQWGQGIAWNNSDGMFFNADAAIRNASVPPYSFACCHVQTGTVGSFARNFARTAQNNGAAPNINWGFDVNDGGIGQTQVDVVLDDNGSPAATIGWTGNSNNALHSFACNVFSTTNASIYGDGAFRQNNGAYTTITQSTTSDAILFSGASSAASSNPFIGFVFYGAFWSRNLSINEIEQLHFDPYAFLIFPEDEIAGVRR